MQCVLEEEGFIEEEDLDFLDCDAPEMSVDSSSSASSSSSSTEDKHHRHRGHHHHHHHRQPIDTLDEILPIEFEVEVNKDLDKGIILIPPLLQLPGEEEEDEKEEKEAEQVSSGSANKKLLHSLSANFEWRPFNFCLFSLLSICRTTL